MQLWSLLTLVFLIQEPISTTGVLLRAYELHYNIWLIHLLFIIATVVDVVIGYYIGIFIKNRFKESKFVTYLDKKAEGFSKFLGGKGKIMTLVFYVPLLFPISIILVPWFDISLTEALIYIFLGELIFWYAYVWLLVLGVNSFASNARNAFYIIIVISIIFTFGLQYFYKKNTKI